ncbi:MAG: holliday junction resolvase Hjr [Thermoanaerobacter sp.]|nr:holliday junction resolvase Hjr [Thermoanaerobacter sp.]
MPTNYRRGYLAERKAVKVLEAAGYVVARTAGSHSPFDVVAVGLGGVRLIQVKRVKYGGIRAAVEAAKEELQLVPKLPGISREIWVWVDGEGWVAQEAV